MKIFNIVCGQCGSHDFKYVDKKPTCKECGIILTDKDIESILHQAYEDFKRSLNKVYYFCDPGRDGGLFIAAKTWKEARNISLKGDYDMLAYISFVEIEGELLRNKDGKPYKTELHGQLELYQLDELGIPYARVG